jgi:hypothetical protein
MRFFYSPLRPERLWDQIQLPIHWVPEALSPGVKRPRRKADDSPPSSAKVLYLHSPNISLQSNSELSIGYVFMVWCFVKYRDNFTYIQFLPVNLNS